VQQGKLPNLANSVQYQLCERKTQAEIRLITTKSWREKYPNRESSTFDVYAQASACEVTEMAGKNREPRMGRRGKLVIINLVRLVRVC
jgi:hypothetical protein